MSFDKVRNYLSNIPYINNGGCAIAALFMHEYLKLENKSSQFVYFYSGDSDSKNVNDIALKDKTVNPVSCTHCGILIDEVIIDCEKVIDEDLYSFQHIIEDEEFIKKSLKYTSKWNSLFDRSIIPQIEKDLNIKLNLNL